MITAAFTEAYQRPPEGVWHAPGRVNLIGEHTDYNDGLVLPFALREGVSVAAARRDDRVLEVRSLQVAGETATIPLDGLAPGAVKGWAAYVAGAAWALSEHGSGVAPGGASLLIDSDLPSGAGLSSSAALESAVALALCELYGIAIPRPELALIAQRAESQFVGMPCGIMDQSASLLCTEGHALLLDCRSGLSSQVPLELDGSDQGGHVVLVVDTGVRHALTDGRYAERRTECERAAELLGVPALRDVRDLPGALAALDEPVLRRRVQHVVTEVHRVEATVGLLRAGAVGEVGAMLTASHLSLRDDFEVSWPEADRAVEAAVTAGARGGRMVGGGFGGSVIVLLTADRRDRVQDAITAAAHDSGAPEPAFHLAVSGPGARRLG